MLRFWIYIVQHRDFVALKSFAAGENGDWWEWWIVGNLAQHEEPTLWQLGPKQHLFKHFLSEEEQNMTRTASQSVFVDCYSNKLGSGLHMRDSLSVPPSLREAQRDSGWRKVDRAYK